MDAVALAEAVRGGDLSATTVVRSALDRIARCNPVLNAFTAITADRARAAAAEVDNKRAAGKPLGPLAGVPFAVKNLFDVKGTITVAGSKIHAENPPATRDATAVRRLEEAGAICVGALNMDEYAYGFTTENTHYGPTCNPHDTERSAGGSSGGSAAAVAGGLVPLTLGTDTNGSIRVPAAFCGILGLQATYGRFSRSGALLFAESFDRIGPFARSVRDLAVCFDLLQGADPADPVCLSEPLEAITPRLETAGDGLRLARAGGYFARGGLPAVFAAVDKVAGHLEVNEVVTIPHAEAARAAAYVMTGTEGSHVHLPNLRTRPRDFDPHVRDRFLAGSLIPGSWYVKAQKFRSVYRAQVLELFNEYDVILAPTTPTPATLIGQETMELDGVNLPVRPNIGLYTQPLSFVGLPIVSVPIQIPGAMPAGVMLIGAPHSEAKLLGLAHRLEQAGIVAAPIPAFS
ncbi:MAG: AtzE family amidohydrolase [Opitutales bacterium]